MVKLVALFCSVTFASLLAVTLVSQAASGPVTIALCPVADDVHDDAHQLYYAADGSRQRLSVSTSDDVLPVCAAATLPLDASILWSAPAPPGPVAGSIRQLGLLGNFTTGTPTVSEVVVIADSNRETEIGTEIVSAVETVSDDSPLALNLSVLPWLAPQTFGIDERVTSIGASQLRCEPGGNIAGALFTAGRPWAAGTALQLEMRAQGQGRFHVALGDALRDTLQTPLRLGEVSLPTSAADGNAGVFRFVLPDNVLPWTSLTIICPPGQGEIELLSLSISSPRGRQQPDLQRAQASPPSQRGAWLWSPQLWQDSPDFVWQTQSQQQLTEIYISIPVDSSGQVADRSMLSQFLTEAHDRGLDVRVVIGDPRDVLPASLPALEARILAFLNYNRDAPTSAQLSGVQLDIEPYLLRGFARAQPYWRERYLSVIRHVHDMLDGRMSLDLVMPAWWGSHQAWGEQLFSQLPVANTRLSIMNYHTSAERLRANAAPFLDWGQQASVPVLIALESGYLPDETHRRYTHHEQEGELWLLPVGDESVYVLFDKPQSGLAGEAFAFAFDYRVPAGDYTFAGDVARLNTVVTELSREWLDSPAFAGIAIHGLDDINIRYGSQ